ncbi:hypothetical protein L0865_003341 [Clostridioides difficile]|nr:hypothetical protein [Clostridioides difficile]EIS9442920.1 hypothetical protein [Clostridioides difficile]MBG0192782.1 hypothetical protein [Clostridioides difficile]MBG0295362.1 hypothetical protein [Clostridioides difficile]MBH7251790.1 hypothetical protein [Clostridioides difficile]
MEFVSDEQVKKVLKKIEKKEFDKISKIELTGDSIKYNFILEYIKKTTTDTRNNLRENTLIYIEEYSSEIDDNLVHILNHILLEVPRASELEYLKNEARRAKNNNDSIRTEIKNNKKTLAECQENISSAQSEFISILSIFAAVIIAFLGGMSLIGSALNNMDNVSKYRLIFVLLTIGFIMFNVIYMLLYIVSKLVHGKIYMEKKECKGCEERKISNCLINRHPLLFYYNYFSSVSIFIVFLLYNIDNYNIFSAIADILNLNNKVAFIAISGSVFLCTVLFIIYKISKQIISNKNCSESNAN